MTAPAHHFTGMDCSKCGHSVFAHAHNPCCRICFSEGRRGRGLCQRDEKCPIDGLLASKHEGWVTGTVPGQLSIDDALGDVIPSRTTDPETSHAAAREVRVKAGTQRARLLKAFADHGIQWPQVGLTDEEAMMNAEGVWHTSEYSKRCSELREGGYIKPTGQTRVGSAGVERIVSKVTDKGLTWIRENR